MSIDAQTLALLADKVQLEVRDYNEETDVETKYYVPFDLETLDANELIVAKITDINVAVTFFEVLETLESHTVYLIFEDFNITKFPQEVIKALKNVNNNWIDRVTIHTPKLRSIPISLLDDTNWFINCYSLNHIEIETDLDRSYTLFNPWVYIRNFPDQAPDSQWLKENLGLNNQQELEKFWAENLNKFLKEYDEVREKENKIELSFTNTIPGPWLEGIPFEKLDLWLADGVTEFDSQTWNSIQQVEDLTLRGKSLTTVDSLNHIDNLRRLRICSNNLKQIPTDLDLPNLTSINLSSYNEWSVRSAIEDKLILNVTEKDHLDLLANSNIVSKNLDLWLEYSAADYFIENPELFPAVESLSLRNFSIKPLDLSRITSVTELNLYSKKEDKPQEVDDNLLTLPAQLVKFNYDNFSISNNIKFDFSKCTKLEVINIEFWNYFREISLPATVFTNLKEVELRNLAISEFYPSDNLVKLIIETRPYPIKGKPKHEIPELKLPEDFSIFPNLRELCLRGIFDKSKINIDKLKNLKMTRFRGIDFREWKSK